LEVNVNVIPPVNPPTTDAVTVSGVGVKPVWERVIAGLLVSASSFTTYALNTASRMKNNVVINKIHCTNHFKEALIQQDVNIDSFVDRGILEIKGK
jgi:hypothetical protein